MINQTGPKPGRQITRTHGHNTRPKLEDGNAALNLANPRLAACNVLALQAIPASLVVPL